MKKNLILFMVTVTTIFGAGCSVCYKKHPINTDIDIDAAIHHVIMDFSKIRKFKVDSIFRVEINNGHGSYLTIGVGRQVNKIPPYVIGNWLAEEYPNKYEIIDGRIFYWRDLNATVPDEINQVFWKHKVSDSLLLDIRNLLDYATDDGDSGRTYYVCKNNIKKFRRTPFNSLERRARPPRFVEPENNSNKW